jgi:hypothetical protein
MVFTLNKAENVGPVTVVVVISLLLLPLHLSNTPDLILSLIETEPVLAQLSGQANANIDNNTTASMTTSSSKQNTSLEEFLGGIVNNENPGNTSTAESFSGFEDDFVPFGQKQQPLTSFSEMDFNLFMESFANSIFNGTSIFGGVGTSMVNGIKVSGIGWDNNESKLSVILSGTPTDVLSEENNTASARNDTTVATTTNPYSSVSVIAVRVPLNMANILSLAADSSSQGMDSSNMMTGDMDFNPDSIFPSDSFNPFSLLSSIEIGSSSLTNADWSVPQTVTMNLVGGNVSQEQQQQSYSNKTTTADLLFVSVIPYTG